MNFAIVDKFNIIRWRSLGESIRNCHSIPFEDLTHIHSGHRVTIGIEILDTFGCHLAFQKKVGDHFGIEFNRMFEDFVDDAVRRIGTDDVNRFVEGEEILVFTDFGVGLVFGWEVVVVDVLTGKGIEPSVRGDRWD